MSSQKLLKNIHVLDFSRLIPGPFATKILCDYGAEVIKIEDMQKGDDADFFLPRVFGSETMLSVYFHKNKKRMKFDFTSEAGQGIVKKLIKKADVLVESYRPGVMKRWGLDYPSLKKLNPKLIYVSLTGYGQNGALSTKAGHDLNFMAVAGMLVPPEVVPHFQMADFVGGGLFAAMQIMSALLERKSTGKGMFLNVAMAENLAYLSQHLRFGREPPELAIVQGQLARYRTYRTADSKWMALGALEDKFWFAFCDLFSKPDWKSAGHDFARNATIAHELNRIFESQPSAYWKAFGEQHDICLTPVASKAEVKASGWTQTVAVECEGRRENFDDAAFFQPAAKQRYARAGHDNVAVLKSVGYSAKVIAELKKNGVIT